MAPNPAPQTLRTHYRRTALNLVGQGLFRLRVTSDSMAPLLRPGDQVVVQPLPEHSLQDGDLVVVRPASPDALPVTHRLVRRSSQGWYTKGDSSLYLDGLLAEKDILGRVLAVERQGKRLDLQSRRWRLANGWLGRSGWWQARVFEFTHRLAGSSPTGGRSSFRPVYVLLVWVFSGILLAPTRLLARLLARKW